ncbi:MAG: signal transduction histidine kinase [Alteromonadaceae bacterium]|jgi:signal transduction histidine kinase
MRLIFIILILLHSIPAPGEPLTSQAAEVWQSWWAYSLYGVIVVGGLLLLINAERKRVNKQQALIEQLQKMDKLKDEFLLRTSHELRAPLNGIIGLAESLMDGIGGTQSPTSANNLSMIVSSGKRLSNLVNDILDFAKLKNNNLALTTQAIHLYPLVELVVALCRPLTIDKSVQLINEVSEDLPPIEADEERLQQIIHNLLDNAIKFTEQGKVTIIAQLEGDWLKISVTDSGIGIASDKLNRIFNSFEQLDHGSHSPVYNGSGLGLAVSKQLVELHTGTITVDSKPAQGSIFCFTIPLSTRLPSPDVAAGQATARSHLLQDEPLGAEQLLRVNALPSQHSVGHDGSSFRLLLVDDDPLSRQVLHNHLSLQNYQLVEATDGEQALQLINRSEPFDLVLLDIMMPKMSGFEVCQTLRKTYPNGQLPVIFLSVKNQIADLVHCFGVSGNDFICKPVLKHELLSRVQAHLDLLVINRDLQLKLDSHSDELQQKNALIDTTRDQLVQADKMASLGTLTTAIAHEINNPTNFVHVSSYNMEIDLSTCRQFIFDLAGEEADEALLDSFRQHFKPLYAHLEAIKNGTDRIKNIVQDLKTFTLLDSSGKKSVEITYLLHSTINLVRTKYLEATDFITDFKSTPTIYCYPAQLNQVFMNLIVNACDAIVEKQQQQGAKIKGQIIVGCQLFDDMVEITIKDSGNGMNEQTKKHLFDPFYTTKPPGEGSGLGLSTSCDIVQKHGGKISVESQANIGSVFRLRLPI